MENVVLVVALVILGFGVAAGCKTSAASSSPGFASVKLEGNTPGQIWATAAQVFRRHGYVATRTASGDWMFEQQGSRMSEIAYGSWMGDTPVWVRVKATISQAGEQAYQLRCSLFVVRDRGTATEEEVAAHGFSHRPIQNILEEVKSSLSPAAAPK